MIHFWRGLLQPCCAAGQNLMSPSDTCWARPYTAKQQSETLHNRTDKISCNYDNDNVIREQIHVHQNPLHSESTAIEAATASSTDGSSSTCLAAWCVARRFARPARYNCWNSPNFFLAVPTNFLVRSVHYLCFSLSVSVYYVFGECAMHCATICSGRFCSFDFQGQPSDILVVFIQNVKSSVMCAHSCHGFICCYEKACAYSFWVVFSSNFGAFFLLGHWQNIATRR